jgi:RecJ-like exonuclease
MAEHDGGNEAGRDSPPHPKDENPHHQAPTVAPGTYESVCPDCAGTGKLRDGQTCPTCDGAGWVTPVGH